MHTQRTTLAEHSKLVQAHTPLMQRQTESIDKVTHSVDALATDLQAAFFRLEESNKAMDQRIQQMIDGQHAVHCLGPESVLTQPSTDLAHASHQRRLRIDGLVRDSESDSGLNDRWRRLVAAAIQNRQA